MTMCCCGGGIDVWGMRLFLRGWVGCRVGSSSGSITRQINQWTCALWFPCCALPCCALIAVTKTREVVCQAPHAILYGMCTLNVSCTASLPKIDGLY